MRNRNSVSSLSRNHTIEGPAQSDAQDVPLTVFHDDKGAKRGAMSSFCAPPRWNRYFRRGAWRWLAALSLLVGTACTARTGPSAAVKHPSFSMTRTTHVEEINADLTMYRHKKTGAEFLAIVPRTSPGASGELRSIFGGGSGGSNGTAAADDDFDRAFGVSFRTVPRDDTGVAHILEHSVLCGSRSYPVKNPFLRLQRGSLHTFLNAFTYADRTVYPVASRNGADFRNLIAVYLDAVFRPNCVVDGGEWVLRQEGWRYEAEDTAEGANEERHGLVYKGVVYSEMKGVYSDPDKLHGRVSQHMLFPDNTYRYDSGGDPESIPTLTREQYLQFYADHYHPSNAKLYVYGDRKDAADMLTAADGYLSEYDARPQSARESEIAWQGKTFAEPLRRRMPYAAVRGKAGHMAAVTWLVNDSPLDPLMDMAWTVLDDMLLGTSSSVLRKALLESGLGADIMGKGLSKGLLQNTFSIGMKGITGGEDYVQKVEDLIMDTLHTVVKDGFEKDDIAASVNSFEFQLREFQSGSTPKGVSIFLRILSKWNYDQDPVSALSFESTLRQLKSNITKSGSQIFQSILRDYMLENMHRVALEFYPSTTHAAEREQEEQSRLSNITQSLSAEQFQDIVDESERLTEFQSTNDPPEAIATIPTLRVQDLNRHGAEYPIDIEDNAVGSDVTLVTHKVPSSSGIAYVAFGMDASALLFEDAFLLPFFHRMIMQTGTSTLSDLELDRQMGIHTGGIGATTLIMPIKPQGVDDSIVTDGTNFRTIFFISGKATSDKSKELFSLFEQILIDAKLDSKDKGIQILQSILSERKRRVAVAGHTVAASRIQARYSPLGFVSENMNYALDSMEQVLDQARNDWPAVLSRIENMRNTFLNSPREGMILDVTGDDAVLNTASFDIKTFLLESVPKLGALKLSQRSDLPNFRTTPHPWVQPALSKMSMSAPIQDEGIATSTQVSYVGKGGLVYNLNEPVPGSAHVVARVLQTGYLWETVRVKNGAYGASATLSPWTGSFYMVSYRDSNLGLTIEAFDAAADSIVQDATKGPIMAEDRKALDVAIIGAIGRLDGGTLSPSQVGSVALRRWLMSQSREARQRTRDEILNTSVEDFLDFAKRLKTWKKTSVAVVSSQASFDEYSSAGGSPLKIIATV